MRLGALIMKIAVRSSLDVALWLSDRALGEGEYIQPQKLHRLMYLAHAYFSLAYPSMKLMPAVFVIEEFGPIEPTVFHALAWGRPSQLDANMLPEVASVFLESIWGKFGSFRVDHLNRIIDAHVPVSETAAKGPGHEIPMDRVAAFLASEAAVKKGVKPVEQVVKPRVLRSQAGRPVTVTAWRPKPLPNKE